MRQQQYRYVKEIYPSNVYMMAWDAIEIRAEDG